MRRFSISLLAILLLLSGCVYYNLFFLAKKNFKEAESQRKKSGLEIAKGGKGKYQTAIEKASQVLEFHPESKYVDDALYIIGRSFYHTGEFSKAETKFREILATYPDSKYAEEAVFYLGKTRYWKEDYVGARESFERIDSISDDDDLRSESMFMLGEILYTQKEWERSVSVYSEYLDEYEGGDRAGEIQFKIGESYFALEDYESAKSAFLEVLDVKADDSLDFQAMFRAGECYYILEHADSGLQIFDDLADDDKNYDHMADLHIQQARGIAILGDLQSAMETYHKTIEEYPRSEQAAVAFYRLGTIFQDEFNDLDSAKAMYDSSTAAKSTSSVSKLAVSKSADIAKLDAYRSGKSAESIEEAVESQFLLAELYLNELNQPDSAVNEFEILIDSFPDSKYAPQALLALGWVQENIRDNPDSAETLYRKMLDEYPSSDFVPDVLTKLGIDSDTTIYDYAERRYFEAERLLFSDSDYETANEIFQSIVDDFPESRYAPKASWAIAWSLANFHIVSLPDSTDSGDVVYDSTNIFAFRKVAELYASTDYGSRANSFLGGSQRVRSPTRPEPTEDTTDQQSEEDEETLDSAAIRDSIMRTIEEEIRNLEPAPDRPSTQPDLEYPLSAYSDPFEGPIKMKVKIDFTGKVTEWEILIGSGREDIDEAVNEIMEHTYFNAGEIDPLLYDTWFFYRYDVIPPVELREKRNR